MDLEVLPEEPEGPEAHAVYPPTRTGSDVAARMAPGMVIEIGAGWIKTEEEGIWLIQLTLAPGAKPRLAAVVAAPPPPELIMLPPELRDPRPPTG